MGDLILRLSQGLLDRAKELLWEVASLIDGFEDPGTDCSPEIDWAGYKKSSRALSKRCHWEKARRKKDRIRALRPLYRSGRGISNQPIKMNQVLTILVRPFSPIGQSRLAFKEEFAAVLKSGAGRRFPWRQHIIRELLLGRSTLSAISPVLNDRKKDAVMRFQTLIEMSHEGQVSLSQNSSFGRIKIESKPDRLDPTVDLREANGALHHLSWIQLTDQQRGKIGEDLACGRIVLARR